MYPHPRIVWFLFAVTLSGLVPLAVCGQGTEPTAGKNAPTRSVNLLAELNKAGTRDDLFESDTRLDRVVSFVPKARHGADLMRSMQSASRCVMRSNDPEPVGLPLFVACDHVKTRALMEAFALLDENSWLHASRDEYVLLNPLTEEASLLEPNSKEEEEVFALGEQFFGLFDQLPATERDKLFGNIAGEPVVPVAELPGPMQDLLQQMTDATNRAMDRRDKERGIADPKRGVPAGRVKEAKILLQPQNMSIFRSFFVRMTVEGSGFVGFRVNLKQLPKTGEGEKSIENPDSSEKSGSGPFTVG